MTSHHQRPVLPLPDARPTRGGSLPEELLAAATARLRLTAVTTAVVSLLRLFFGGVVDVGDVFGTPRELEAKLWLFTCSLALSVATFVLSFVKLPPRRHVRIGQVFFIVLVAIFAATEATSPYGEQPFVRGVPLNVPVILIFPVIIPMSLRQYFITSGIAILSVPIMMAVMPGLVGNPLPLAKLFVLDLVPHVIAVGVGGLTAHVIYSLGRDLKRAQKMGSYQLVAPLGKGGMGEVWRAKHGMLAREAAVKLIRRDRAGADGTAASDALKRFEHEARVVASLRSQHTIQLYDFGTTDDGALYYAMELLDGMDLDRLVQEHGPLPPERVVHLMLQACHSLAEAHEAGLVHRDIKPANLFVTRLGRDVDVVKVLDFGLATKPLAERLADARVTVDGVIVGTPAYMAPEQVLGEALDGRADLYALGLVAWWLLTGRDTFRATSSTQVMFAHVHVEAEAPSAHATAPIPVELERAILRCLAKKREHRPQSADELAEMLRAVPLAAPWTRARALAWWRDAGRSQPASVAPDTSPAAVAETRNSPAVDSMVARPTQT